jgi:kinetochor protein Mis14/NSL1
MAEFHRKIELQAPEDLQYLVGNAKRAAKEYLDKDFPPDLREEGDNSLHEQLERNVNKVRPHLYYFTIPLLGMNRANKNPLVRQRHLHSCRTKHHD